MSNTFTISQGQGHEVEQALGRNGWTNALLKKATKGDFFAKVLLVLEGKAEIVMIAADKAAETIIQKVTNLLRLVKETEVSDMEAKKMSESFVVGSRYYHRDSDLDGWLSAQQEAGASGKVSVYQLEREMTFKEVAQALLGVDEASIGELAEGLIAGGHTVVPSQIEALIERTEQGEDTGLITDGYGNFFFVQDKKGSVSVVNVRRLDVGLWYVDVYRLDCEGRSDVEDRFFSRN